MEGTAIVPELKNNRGGGEDTADRGYIWKVLRENGQKGIGEKCYPAWRKRSRPFKGHSRELRKQGSRRIRGRNWWGSEEKLSSTEGCQFKKMAKRQRRRGRKAGKGEGLTEGKGHRPVNPTHTHKHYKEKHPRQGGNVFKNKGIRKLRTRWTLRASERGGGKRGSVTLTDIIKWLTRGKSIQGGEHQAGRRVTHWGNKSWPKNGPKNPTSTRRKWSTTKPGDMLGKMAETSSDLDVQTAANLVSS